MKPPRFSTMTVVTLAISAGCLGGGTGMQTGADASAQVDSTGDTRVGGASGSTADAGAGASIGGAPVP